MSNMYRAYEEGAALRGELRVQAPVPVYGSGGWHILALDMARLVSEYSRGTTRFDHVRAVTICASLSVRNIFTSDYRYDVMGCPPEMALSAKPEVLEDVVLRWIPSEPLDVRSDRHSRRCWPAKHPIGRATDAPFLCCFQGPDPGAAPGHPRWPEDHHTDGTGRCSRST